MIEERRGTVAAHDGVPIAWRAFLPPHPRATFIVLHGVAEHGGRYPDLVDRLTGEGYAVFAPDLRGFGLSGGRRGSVKRFSLYVDDVGRVVDDVVARYGGGPRFVLGYSLGGAVAVRYALCRQELITGMVLAAPAIGIGPGFSMAAFAAARAFSVLAPQIRIVKMDPAAMMQDPDMIQRYRADPLVHHGRLDSSLVGKTVKIMAQLPDDMRALTVPLLILHGEDDRSADPNGSRVGLDNAGSADKELHFYPGMRHEVFNEPGREAALDDLATWVRRHLQATPSDQRRDFIQSALKQPK